MAQSAPAVFKIPTKSPQPARGKPGRPAGRAKTRRPASGRVLASGTGRAATRGGGEVIELEYGITVYPAREEHGRWRAVWYETGERQQCEAASEEKLAARLEKVKERLEADAPNMKRPGADLIAWYLDPDRLPVDERWSRKHVACCVSGVPRDGWRGPPACPGTAGPGPVWAASFRPAAARTEPGGRTAAGSS